ncbi:class I SAM-dependent methyltransferase [Amycolatopsis endophytica]|uniref:SAM-dependent methyltransferase n=1 Tax=Amycolatopsis endophytica TaxID=860233 RepID=A0A853B7S1_9PSEU|nr:class I SAM-dependent methyltransferase [Amycolatopsis endophytica]NYI91358.1 SAM-dependent methyltransferase [Amycolatopsis endophytica]
MIPDLDQDPADFWETLYHDRRQDASVWGARVNPILTEVAAGLTEGAALDLGCGAGGDTMWLARRGWRVTAVDISATAVEQVRRLAREAGLDEAISAERHDLADTFPDGTFDLVSAQYFHTPFALPRATILRAAAQALRPGGRLLVVDHGSIAPWSWNQDHSTHIPDPAEVHAELDLPPAWTVERADRPEREATGPDGRTATVTDNVLLIRRAV